MFVSILSILKSIVCWHHSIWFKWVHLLWHGAIHIRTAWWKCNNIPGTEFSRPLQRASTIRVIQCWAGIVLLLAWVWSYQWSVAQVGKEQPVNTWQEEKMTGICNLFVSTVIATLYSIWTTYFVISLHFLYWVGCFCYSIFTTVFTFDLCHGHDDYTRVKNFL